MNTSWQSTDNFFPARIDKTLKWLEESRDSWKGKTKVAKDDLKKKKLAVRTREMEELKKKRLLH